MTSLTLVMLNIFMYYTPPQFYPVNLQPFTCKHVFSIRVENSVDSDPMASTEAIWSGSLLFSEKDKSRFSGIKVKLHL